MVVNSRTGTAAFVSTGRPGSVHDVTVMRTDSAAINGLVGRATLLGDKGYRGGESSVPMLFVVEDETRRELRVQRTLVECFFGRLKNKYKAFGRKWFLGVDMFDGFFDCACALTNADILVNPLSADDQQHNQTILNLWQAEEADRLESRRVRNDAYRRRVEAERSALGTNSSPTTVSHRARFWAQHSTIDSFAFLFNPLKLNEFYSQKMPRLLFGCHQQTQ